MYFMSMPLPSLTVLSLAYTLDVNMRSESPFSFSENNGIFG